MALNETGDRILKQSRIRSSLIYLFLDMSIDLKLVISFTIIALAFIYVPFIDQILLRYVFGLILVLLLPGYSFISAVFPGKPGLDDIERAILSVGFSIVLVPIMGLLLNFTEWGIRLEPITVCIALFILICCGIANFRRHGLPPDERYSLDLKAIYSELTSWAFKDAHKNKTEMFLSAVVIICLLMSIMAVAYAVIVPRHAESYSEFYINGPDGKAENYPTQFILGDQKPIIIGIVNEEQRDVPYSLYVSLNDSGNKWIIYSEQIKLANGQAWEKLVYLTPYHIGTNMTMDFSLYADGNLTAPYRACSLMVNVSAPERNIHLV